MTLIASLLRAIVDRIDPPQVAIILACHAPHCWSEYGTPCGTCPYEVARQAAMN